MCPRQKKLKRVLLTFVATSLFLSGCNAGITLNDSNPGQVGKAAGGVSPITNSVIRVNSSGSGILNSTSYRVFVSTSSALAQGSIASSGIKISDPLLEGTFYQLSDGMSGQ